jgi:hypothetical protein
VENPSFFPLPAPGFPTVALSVGKIAEKVLDPWITVLEPMTRCLKRAVVLHRPPARDVQKAGIHICTPPITTFYKILNLFRIKRESVDSANPHLISL